MGPQRKKPGGTSGYIGNAAKSETRVQAQTLPAAGGVTKQFAYPL